jgi:hypothetical protein
MGAIAAALPRYIYTVQQQVELYSVDYGTDVQHYSATTGVWGGCIWFDAVEGRKEFMFRFTYMRLTVLAALAIAGAGQTRYQWLNLLWMFLALTRVA